MKHPNIILLVGLLLVGGLLFSRYYLVLSHIVSPIISSDWEGTWVLDKQTDEGHYHGMLSIKHVGNDIAEYELLYTLGEATRGRDSKVYENNSIRISRRKIVYTTYTAVSGRKSLVETYRLSSDKQTIQKTSDTCPSWLDPTEVTNDGCEKSIDDGIYRKTSSEIVPMISKNEATSLFEEIALPFVGKVFQTKVECMVVFDPEQNQDSYIFTIHENHKASCGGDPATSPHITDIFIKKTTGDMTYSIFDKDSNDFGSKVIPRPLSVWINGNIKDSHFTDHYLVSSAIPAKTTFVRDLVMNRSLLDVIPVLYTEVTSYEFTDAVDQARKQKKTLGTFFLDDPIMDYFGGTEAIFEDENSVNIYGMDVYRAALGDFNHDGIEDIMICYSGMGGGCHIYTRKDTHSLLTEIKV